MSWGRNIYIYYIYIYNIYTHTQTLYNTSKDERLFLHIVKLPPSRTVITFTSNIQLKVYCEVFFNFEIFVYTLTLAHLSNLLKFFSTEIWCWVFTLLWKLAIAFLMLCCLSCKHDLKQNKIKLFIYRNIYGF